MGIESKPSQEGKPRFTLEMPDGSIEDVSGKSSEEIGQLMQEYRENHNN